MIPLSAVAQQDDRGERARPLRANGAALDVHTHIASQVLTDFFTGGGVPAIGADDLVAKLDEAHVKRAVILSAAYFGFPDDANVVPENDYVAAEIAKFPDRLIGFCGINPLYDSALAEIDRCLGLPGMVGVKLHLEGSVVDLTDDSHVEKLNAVFDRIAELDAPVMMHVSEANELPLSARSFGNLAAVLSAHPTVRVAFAHCAGHTDDDTIELWLRLHNSGYNPETSFVDVSACLAFYIVTGEWQQEVTRPEDGAIVRRWSRSKIDRVNQLEHTEDRYDVIVNGDVVASEARSRSPATRIYTQEQVVKLVESVGFTNVHVCSGFTRQPATPADAVFTVLGMKS